jgi:hypothetical protein
MDPHKERGSGIDITVFILPQVVGVEILNVKKRVPEANLKEIKFEVA